MTIPLLKKSNPSTHSNLFQTEQALGIQRLNDEISVGIPELRVSMRPEDAAEVTDTAGLRDLCDIEALEVQAGKLPDVAPQRRVG